MCQSTRERGPQSTNAAAQKSETETKPKFIYIVSESHSLFLYPSTEELHAPVIVSRRPSLEPQPLPETSGNITSLGAASSFWVVGLLNQIGNPVRRCTASLLLDGVCRNLWGGSRPIDTYSSRRTSKLNIL